MAKFIAFSVVILGVIVGVLLLAALLAYPTMWLVNYLIAPNILLLLFGVAKLNFWKALALNTFVGVFIRNTNVNSKS